ncbi:TAXI family TRAP transporter solute-binding subunit [Natronosporangium hydrolyticum]|uniref:TAXI family TRAP transporter solute-binding subunit n=1 Tax=Natronosporangium hydrolyticum TaxID=2811111 RepID=A0A895YCW1_9ACTN|nr:TAXI family TRAP transporter solute-binding subunit [Natronosporangium hydrolyticum]QSB15654.1 TAXI family TRAP transporter solute-binding subunit [Natronosporangium hydrolyticum]
MTAVTRRVALRATIPAAVTALILTTACAPDDSNGEEPGDAGELSHMLLATGSTGGTYYPLGGGMASIWSEGIDGLTVSVQASGASVENLRLLQAGEVELIMAVNGVAINAMNGEGDFAGEDHDFMAIGNVYAEVTQIVARADAEIETIADLAGKRVQIGPAGSGTEVSARQILDYHGIDADSDIDSFQDSFGDAADQLRDGTVDAAFGILALPAASIIDVATGTDLVMVDLEGEPLEQMLADDASLSAVEVPEGTYPGQDDAATWVTNWATLYVAPGLDEDQVYELVSLMYEGMDPDTVGHAVADEIQLDTAIDGLGGVPLHPGAERYYEEQGVDLP